MRKTERQFKLRAAASMRIAVWGSILLAGAPIAVSVRAAEPAMWQVPMVGRLLLGAADAKSNDKTDANPMSVERRKLNQLVFRIARQHQRDLVQAVSELEAGKTVRGLAYLQRLLDHSQDGFVWVDSNSRLSSVFQEASRILSHLDQAALHTYERLYGSAAHRLLSEARRSGDPNRYREIGRRFLHTTAGFEAIDWQASRWMDEGRYALAARGWARLLSQPCHRKRITPTFLLKAALANRLSGQPSRSESLLKRIGQRRSQIAGRTVVPAKWLQENSRPPAAKNSTQRPVVMGNARRNGTSAGSTPYLKPAWSAPFVPPSGGLIHNLVDGWNEQRAMNSRSAAVANFAIVVGNNVLVRDFESIRQLNLATGKTVWKYRCETSLMQLAADLVQQSKSRRDPNLFQPSRSFENVHQAYAGNSVMGMLASDGARVYAVDGMDLSLRKRHSWRGTNVIRLPEGGAPPGPARHTNRLIALEIATSPAGDAVSKQPIWSIGGDKHETRLAGHFFLGPPLPVDGRLYAVTESDRQLNLVAIRPENGELLWSQGLGYVSRPIDGDINRYPLSCSPSFSRGVIVCPTQTGLLVGVDALNGSLLWAYYYGEEQTVMRWRGRPAYVPTRMYGHPGFANLPHIHRDRIVYMPCQSKFIHCVDLFTGRQIWKVERDRPVADRSSSTGDQYVASVTDDAVMIVGDQRCRGLSLTTGEELWANRVGKPSGRGVRVAAGYLLPLEQGHVVTIDLDTGRQIGVRTAGVTARMQENWKPGNLVAGKGMIVSAGARRITAFPQAGQLLGRIQDRLESNPESIEDLILASELELSLGHLETAKSHLRTILSSQPTSQHRAVSEGFLRELLYAELDAERGDELAVLDQLYQLANSAEERGRYLLLKAESQLRHADVDGVLNSTREFASLNLKNPLSKPDDSAHWVSAASWVPLMLGRVREQFGDAGSMRVNEQIEFEMQAALSAGQIDRLEKFLTVYSRQPQAVPVRIALAQKLIDGERFQEAELLLLENRRSRDSRTAAIATAKLVELWDRLGLHQEAAGLLNDLVEQYADVSLADGRTGRDFAERLPRNSLTYAEYRQMQALDWRVRRVRITQQPRDESDVSLLNAYRNYSRRFVTPHGSTFELLDRGGAQNGGSSRLSVIDKRAGVLVGSIAIPSTNTYSSLPQLARRSHVGHFFTLGSTAALHGISLLEHKTEKPNWTKTPKQLAGRNDRVRAGPVGPSFCTFQADRQLLVVSPANGRILWQRTDLDPKSGLINNSYAGLFGDEQTLVLLGADRSTYTVYDTVTGEQLRRGKVEFDPRQIIRPVFGRRLYYYHTSSSSEKRLRCWDPLHDRVVLDEPLHQPSPGRYFTYVTQDNELAAILADGRLRIIDMASGEPRLEMQTAFQDLTGVSNIRVFSDRQRYYINLWRPVHLEGSENDNYYSSQTFLETTRIRGDLYAVDRSTGKLLWKRTLPYRSVVHVPRYQLPFLVTMSSQSSRQSRGQQLLLVEVLDAETGRTIGLNDQLRPDRMLRLSYDRDQGRLELHGLTTRIELNFGRASQWPTLDRRPL